MNKSNTITSLIKLIKENKKFLISSHVNPEGDSIGCQLAFKRLLELLGKEALIVNNDKVPQGYRFIPGWDSIQHNLNKIQYDILVLLDCSDFSRIGQLKHKLPKDSVIINIDHHISNKFFGKINWVDYKSSSTCQMIYKLYKRLAIPIDREIALALYTGLVSDTGSFRYPNTTHETLAIASKLVKYNLAVYDIYHSIFGGFSVADLKIAARILLSLHYNKEKRIVWFILEKDLLNKNSDIADLILSLARLLKDADAVILFKELPERPNEIRVNFRSNGKVDVNKIASVFGGGGHTTASSCTIKSNLIKAQQMVLKAF